MSLLVNRNADFTLETFDRLKTPALIIDANLKILSSNHSAENAFHYSADDVVGRHLSELIAPGNGDFVETGEAGPVLTTGYEHDDGQEGIRHESVCRKKNGDLFAARAVFVPYPKGGRQLVVIQDLSEQKRLELINEFSGIINSSLSIGTVFRIMVSEIRKLIGYSRASLLLFNEKGNNLLIFALDTDMKTVMKKGVKAPIEGTSAGWVITNNRPWINYDLRNLKFPLDKKLLDEGIRSTISIPLFHDKILGGFNLDSIESCKYSEKDLQILLPAAKHISVALENALLFEEISKEKKEWERTFDALTDMVWIEDGGQKVIRANNTLLMKTGFSAVEAAGRLCGTTSRSPPRSRPSC